MRDRIGEDRDAVGIPSRVSKLVVLGKVDIGSYIVEIQVDTTKVGEDKIAYGVCALNGLGIVVKSVEEPRIFGGDELARHGVCPKLRSWC